MTGEELRRRRRSFVAEHHPDRGGDPAAFVAGLARLDAQSVQDAAPARVVGIPRARGLDGVLRRLRAARQRRQAPPRVR